LPSPRQHQRHGTITAASFRAIAENSLTRDRNCVMIFVAAPIDTKLLATVQPLPVNSGKSGGTAATGETITGTATTILGHGIAGSNILWRVIFWPVSLSRHGTGLFVPPGFPFSKKFSLKCLVFCW